MQDKLAKILAFLLLIMPLFSLVHMYYPNFSASLYAGTKNYMIISTSNTDFQKYHSNRNHQLVCDDENPITFNPHFFAIDNLHVPIPMSSWVYHQLALKFYEHEEEAKSFIVHYPFRTAEKIDL